MSSNTPIKSNRTHNMFVMLWFVVCYIVSYSLIHAIHYSYSSGLLHWQVGEIVLPLG